ncbi:E3 ubiquitin-protein ligase rnf8-A-like [Daktulosphaira vitifoliae]|uniref:E3 ubiquitin-protein ligase rnf8-A-like n=1 Tax=Daktulosphaira vitifoliae TaxID=58002 RepID=UPI0021AAB4C0|nr:E3 ubiquitin-protein ligase rnf8-A-like [Daktulosphaira vitifoliae]
MSLKFFYELFSKLEKGLNVVNSNIRIPTSSTERLCITLRRNNEVSSEENESSESQSDFDDIERSGQPSTSYTGAPNAPLGNETERFSLIRRNNEVSSEENESSESQSDVDDILKSEQASMKRFLNAKFDQFNEIINQASKKIKKLKKTVLKHKLANHELTRKNLDYENTLKIQQDQISKIEETIKKKVYSVLESDLQCSICNELMVKACTINCSHTFCEICLNTWLRENNVCPLCRTSVQTETLCLSMDNFITNICNVLGNEIKEHRENIQQERLAVNVRRAPQMARRGRRRR